MSEKIGRFEIISQIAQSPTATVYKALDTETQQTVALKVLRLDQAKDRAALMQSVEEEAEQAKSLSSHNIAALYGVGDEGDQLLAATEYVQGNSVATTLSRKEGFSIWDLQDIARQVCQALDHARGHNVVHKSLEPAKIMVQWDGLIKVLGFGISGMSTHAMQSGDAIPEILYYASPEQLRGEACDHRSSLFSLGAVLYEMATEQKAFQGETVDQVRTAILENTPPMPHRLKANVNPGLSTLIMKALSKSPDERHQSGQELVQDLEQCKNAANSLANKIAPPAAKPKAFAAAAGVGASPNTSKTNRMPSMSASAAPAVAPANEETKPRFAVDPMMADADSAGPASRNSFSDVAELPPLKETYTAPPPPPSEQEEPTLAEQEVFAQKPAVEKAKVQVREVAQRAATQIRKTPPKLYLYGVGGAVLLIVVIVLGMTLYNFVQDHDWSGRAPAAAPVAAQPQPAAPAQTAPQAAPPAPNAAASAPEQTQPETDESANSPQPKSRGRKTKLTVAAVETGAQLSVFSTPAGAQITFDGSPLCQAPCTLTGIAPGQHTVVAAKAGYANVTRNLAITSGGNSSVSLELAQAITTTLTVSSNPAGAVIVIDGKDTGKLTPSAFNVNKPGTHTVTLQRAGYLEQSSTLNIESGQAATVNLTLSHLGDTEDIKAVGGKFKKMFGGKNANSDMGIVSIKTQPKGAQIMINNRVLDRNSPFDFYLNPGTYVLDVTMSGYKPIHRVINVQEGEKFAIEETLNPE